MYFGVLLLIFATSVRAISSEATVKLINVMQLDDHLGERDKRSAFKFPPTMRFNLTNVDGDDQEDVLLTLRTNPWLSVDPPVYQSVDDVIQKVDTKVNQNHALYQDLENGAAVMLECGDMQWSCKLTGTFYKEKIHYYLTPTEQLSSGLSNQHLLHRVERSGVDLDFFRSDAVPIPSSVYHHFDGLPIPNNTASRPKRATSDIPPGNTNVIEAMAFPDEKVYERFYKLNRRDHRDTVQAMKLHYALIINEVDLRYQSVKLIKPSLKIRVYLSAVYIATTPEEAPWAYENVLCNHDPPLLSEAALSSFSYWQSQNRDQFEQPFDLALAFTGRDYAYPEYFGYTPVLLGTAWLNSLCNDYDYYQTAVIEDKGDFVTALTAAHEMGHSLGANHNEDVATDLVCSYDDYNIMSAIVQTPTAEKASNPFHFSECSVIQFETFIDSLDFNCLKDHNFNQANYSALRGEPLAGSINNVWRACKQKYGPTAKPENQFQDGMCLTGINCMVKDEVVGRQTVLDGTVCSPAGMNQKRKWCWKNQCVTADSTTEFNEEKRSCLGQECCADVLFGKNHRCCKNPDDTTPCFKWIAVQPVEPLD